MKHVTMMMVTLTICMILSMTGYRALSQGLTPSPPSEPAVYWLDMIQDPSVPFAKTQATFDAFWKNRTDYKANGWKVFKRWEYINEFRVLANGKLQAPGYVMEEYTRYMAEHDASAASGGNWTIQGPVSYPVNNTGQPTGMGRLNTIAFHPTDANTIFVGAASGGIWKTTDGGVTWTNLSNNLPWLGVSSILIHPVNPDIIYIGTGDRDAADAPGVGVYKTTDGGSSWLAANSTMGNVIVGAMVMHPSDPNTLLAATSQGIFKTTDGAVTWSAKLAPGNFKDIKLKPGDPSTVYSVLVSSGGARFYRSANTGENWSWITAPNGVPVAGSRMVIGVSPANPATVYLVQIKPADNTFEALLRSTDSGQNFTTMSTSPNIFDYNCDGSGVATQATYDLCIAVDPTDANTLYVGSINNWKSTDGGATWTINSMWAGTCSGSVVPVHADQHWFEWSPLNGRLYVANDGGLYWTDNGGATWTENSNGLAISQIYRIGQGTTNSNYVLMGFQDNGSAATKNGNEFYTTRGGDGTECIIDYSNPNYCYNTYILGSINRSETGLTGSYANIASTGAHGISAGESGAWVTPYIQHRTKDDTMYAGYKNVWRSVNVKATPASVVTWTAISAGETTTCRVMEQSKANTGILYVVRPGSLKRTDNADDAAASVVWTTCTLPGGYTPTDLESHPTNPDIIYATAGYSVYKSADRGLTWTDLDPSWDLPELFTNCLVYDKNSDEGIYVGNQVGVWYKDATMSAWTIYSTGLPPVDIREMEIFYDPVGTQHRLKAGTYGRGLWQTDLLEHGVINPTDFTATPVSNDQIDLGWNLNALNDNVMLAFSTTPGFGTPVNGTSYSSGSSLPGGGTVLYNGNGTTFDHTALSASTTFYYKLWSYDGTTTYSGGTTANATTLCQLVSSFPWTEGFEHSGTMPSCWTQEYINGSAPWEMKTAGTNSHPASAHTGTYLARCRTLTSSAHYVTKFITPALKLSTVANPVLKFWHTQEFWSPNQDELRVYYRTSLTGAWNLLATYSSTIATWTEETINLPAASSTYFIAFEATVNAGYGVCLDDISITSGCTNPEVPVVSATINPVCAGSYTELSIASGNLNSATGWEWYTSSCGGTTVGSGTSINVNPGESTTYYVRGTGGCVTPGTCGSITVNVNPLLPVSVTVNPSENPLCDGTLVEFTASPVNGGISPHYQWLVNNQPVGTNSNVYSYLPVNGDMVRVVLTSNETCISGSPAVSNTVTLSVTPVSAVTVSVSCDANPVCTGTEVSFTATPVNEGSAPVYQWKVNGMNTGTNTTTFSYIPSNNDMITCQLTSDIACSQNNPANSLPVTMSVNTNPTAINISPSSASICHGETVHLVSTGGTGTATVFKETFNGSVDSWTLINNSTGGSPANAAWTVHPDGYVYDEAFHSNDNSAFIMSNSDAQGGGTTTTILESPVINLSGIISPTLRFYHFYNHMAGGSGVVQAFDGTSWNTLMTFNQATIGTATSFALQTINLAAYAGKPDFKIRFVYTVDWGWSWAIDNVSITAPASVTWSPITGLFTDASATIAYAAGNHALSVYAKPESNQSYAATATLAPGCNSLSGASAITVNPILPVSVSIAAGSLPVMVGVPATFTATPVNGGSTPHFQWMVNGLSAGTDNPVFIYTPTGPDAITCQLTSSEGCSTGNPAISNTIHVLGNPAPVTAFPTAGGCPGEELIIPVSVTGFNNIGAVSLTLHYNPAIMTFTDGVTVAGFPLTFGNALPGTVTIGGYSLSGITYPGTAVLFNLIFSYHGGSTDLGWFDEGFTCEYEDASGNVLYDSPTSTYYINGQVTQIPEVTQPVFDPGPNSTRCQAAEVLVYHASAANSTGIVYSLDALSLAGGNLIDASTGTVTWNENWHGNSEVTAHAEGCHDKYAVHTITTYPAPSGSVAIEDPIVCNGGTAAVSITATGGTGNLLFTFGPVQQINNGIFTGIPAGTYAWSVQDENLCGFSGSLEVDQPDPVQVTGTVKYNNAAQTLLHDITVNLRQGGIIKYSTSTDAFGAYQFANVCAGDYEVELSTSRNIGGVNAGDAAAVNYYGINPSLIGRVTYEAGDFTGPFNKINSTDAGSILAYFLNLYHPSYASSRGKWVFWPSGDMIQQVNTLPLFPVPGPVDPLPPVHVEPGSGPFNYSALVTGDFNRSYNPATAKAGDRLIRLEHTSTLEVPEGISTSLAVLSGKTLEVGAISLILRIPAEWMDIDAITLGTSSEKIPFVIHGDELRLGWHALQPLNVSQGDTLMILHLRNNGNEAVNKDAGISLADSPLNELSSIAGVPVDHALILLQNPVPMAKNSLSSLWEKANVQLYPNPCDDFVILTVELPEDATVSAGLNDITGRQITQWIEHRFLTSGRHEFRFATNGLNPGIYFVSVACNGQHSNAKIIRKLILK